MKTFLALVSLLTVMLTLPVVAAPKKGKGPAQEAAPEMRIVEVDAVRIRISLGKTGEDHVDYKITDQTTVTLNGAPIAARDLRAGMVAKVQASPDHSTAISITAKDAPPTHPVRHRVG